MSDSTTSLKICSKCRRELPADENHFYRDRDRLSSRCKECKGSRFGRVTVTPSKEGYRTCHKCKRELELTTDNFYKNNSAKSGFMHECKTCHKVNVANRQRANPEKTHEYNRRTYYKNIEVNRERGREHSRRYRLRHPDKVKEQFRRWYKSHPERRYKTAIWREQNRERTRQYAIQWQRENPEKRRVTLQRRAARIKSYADTLTYEQWQRAVNYFNGCCAVCGRQANDLFNTHTIAADHWIPLASISCPGTVATNIVPLCHGQGGCNNSKKDKPAEQWLIDVFGKRRAFKILSRIEAYFHWVMEQDKA